MGIMKRFMAKRRARREAAKLRRRLQRQYLRYDMGLMRGTNKTALAQNMERERELAAYFIHRIKCGDTLNEWDWSAAVMDLYMGD